MTLFRILFEMSNLPVNESMRDALDQSFQGYGYMRRVYGIESMPPPGSVAKLSITDTLTQCYNRTAFELFVKDEIDRAHRYDHTFGAIIIDVRHFREINRKIGVYEASTVLIELAKVLRTIVRATDMLFRFESDVFMILLPFCDNEKMMLVRQKIEDTIEQHSFSLVDRLHVLVEATLYTKEGTLFDFIDTLETSLQEKKSSVNKDAADAETP